MIEFHCHIISKINIKNVKQFQVWSSNNKDDSEEIARKAFLELEKHKSEIEQTKATLHSYSTKQQIDNEFDVKDLLAQGEDVTPERKSPVKKKLTNRKKKKDDSDSEIEDWEEVQGKAQL